MHVGWAKGFLDDEHVKLPEHELLLKATHPREAIAALAEQLQSKENQGWYD